MALSAALAALALAPHLTATRTSASIHVDGRLDEPAWQSARPSSALTQKFPSEGKPPAEPTTIRVLYDDDALYVGIDCEQRTAKIVAPLTRRDRKVESDSVTIAIDSRRDGTSAFELSVT